MVCKNGFVIPLYMNVQFSSAVNSLIVPHFPLLLPKENLDEIGEHLLPVGASQRQRDLRLHKSVGNADIVPPPTSLQREVFLPPGEFLQRGSQLDLSLFPSVLPDMLVKNLKDRVVSTHASQRNRDNDPTAAPEPAVYIPPR